MNHTLFNDTEFEPKNIVYVDESNPFQVYRMLYQTMKRYTQSFELLNGCKITISALSSKLMTLGAFLAVFVLKKEGKNVGIMQVESFDHQLDSKYSDKSADIDSKNKLYEIWLAGEPYDEN